MTIREKWATSPLARLRAVAQAFTSNEILQKLWDMFWVSENWSRERFERIERLVLQALEDPAPDDALPRIVQSFANKVACLLDAPWTAENVEIAGHALAATRAGLTALAYGELLKATQ